MVLQKRRRFSLASLRFSTFSISQHLHVLNAGETGVQEDQKSCDQQQQHAQGSSKRPVSYGSKLVFNYIADIENLAAAKHVCNRVCAQSWDKCQNDSGEDARKCQWKRTPKKSDRRFCSQIRRCFQGRLLQLLNGSIQGKNRKWQKVCYQAQ